MRHPNFRKQVHAFEQTGEMQRLKEKAIVAIVTAAADRFGYVIEAGWGRRSDDVGPDVVRARIMDDGHTPSLTYSYRGFEHSTAVPEGDVTTHIAQRFAGKRALVNLFDPVAQSIGTSRKDIGAVGDHYPAEFWVR